METAEKINAAASAFVWGPAMLGLFLLSGAYFTLASGLFPFRHPALWLKKTFAAAVADRSVRSPSESGSISRFASASTALAATIGTGNIAGVATAIESGGPGAIFWMWLSAALGMMTAFAEKSLGEAYRFRGEDGQWRGGPMPYMEKGAKSPFLACLYSMLCILASFGIGNMAQSNSIAEGLLAAFSVPKAASGAALALIVALVALGGAKRVGSVASALVPAMAALYIGGGAYALFLFRDSVPAAFSLIIKEAFNFKAAFGGAAGYGISVAIRQGIARGVFSNEAGLGASVLAYESADPRPPAETGMWGIFEVFCDTILVCTFTALVILSTGAYDMGAFLANRQAGAINMSGTVLAGEAFSRALPFGREFVAVSIALFAFSSIIGWSCFGASAVRYLFGAKAVPVFKAAFVLALPAGAIGGLGFVWALSDTFNGMMALPNLAALAILRKEAVSYAKGAIPPKAHSFRPSRRARRRIRPQ
jgi:AGCS family alanine or glycine:cation symporter